MKSVIGIVIVLIIFALFTMYMQGHPTECDEYGFPVCSGEP